MFSTLTVVIVIGFYMALLFAVAQVVEKRSRTKASGNRSVPPLVYALAITVYCTSWTFYGSVGFAAESGLLFLAIYVGSILAILTWWRTLRRMVRVKESYHISSIADFISARYSRSQWVAALVTLIALFGIVPYIALQLKAIIATLGAISSPLGGDDSWSSTGALVTAVMILFTVMFGARHLDPTERHHGMMAVLAVQSLVKLAAFMAVGIFVTYGLFDGFEDIFQRIHYAGLTHLFSTRVEQGTPFVQWATLMILGAASIQCLPRQFHVAVVENSRETDIRKAMWVVPLYLLLINLFVIPIAAGGLLLGFGQGEAESFVLRLPQYGQQPILAMVAFIGGFSAATGMVIISAMALSTMATNHLLVPFIERFNLFAPLRHYLLQCRWVMIALLLCSGYWFAWQFSDSYMLPAMGMISFVAVFQFVPSMFAGLFWRGGNKAGAIAGLLAGFMTWLYTLVLPTFIAQDGFQPLLLSDGPWGISWLRPQALFGLENLSPVSHSVFWSLLFNAGFYALGSMLYRPSKLERTQRSEFMATLESGAKVHKGRPTGLEAYINFPRKKREAVTLLAEYLNTDKAEVEVERIAADLQVEHKKDLTIIELVEFHRMLENVLAGSIGAASAHHVIESSIRYSERETRDLKAIYSHIMTELHGQQRTRHNEEPAEAEHRYTFIEDLQQKLDDRNQQIEKHQQQLDRLEARLEKSDQKLFDQRLVNQKLTQEIQHLRKQLEESVKEAH
ncbi:sodium:solute symporter family protein [Motiliproteus sp. SC1-56]|uniref:sodium:solute symporter family protein n=1 Tax=Motiliproteus sp. SC1-56 TaxID=2799565 RepID=UPI001A8F3ED1|nr:sodium:solute symporter [Motiliproteus sp. SC1-56]